MLHKLLVSSAILAILTVPALADYAPGKKPVSRTELKSICDGMGVRGVGMNLGAVSGRYSCQNAETGNAITCGPDGQCTEYGGDPRWQRIQALIKGAGKKDRPKRI